jgi:hypothetical protein
MMQKNALGFIKKLQSLEYEISGSDRFWDVLFPDNESKWNHLHINQYQATFYLYHVNGDGVISVGPGNKVEGTDSFGQSKGYIENEPLWEHLLTYAYKWLVKIDRDWIKANRLMQQQYPPAYRYGIVPHSLIRTSLTDFYRLDKELGKRRMAKVVKLVEDGWFRRDANLINETMTANDFFEYCRIAYIAAKRKDDKVDASLTGREMYTLYADGRHEGILDIDPSSPKAFADWIDHKHPKYSGGGHPWEIKRGGTKLPQVAISEPAE